ncbi:unnamed protein product [Brachionus calyciflorus]|uniref:IST1 homolog n=1 Tax=Brachionus calyciflorus TaxID=104777 RepID=A0A813VJ77_9BILA|nr:unnamed protein product [Brachionus calyciflorus]
MSSKLKTNLKVAIQRLKLLQKKKTENARKYTKEIADYLQINKFDRARIKVEYIIREDYIVEGMEIVEMYCDLLLARFGLVESMKELDLGLYECVASLLWVAPRLESECNELRVISDELERKYGKEFCQMCRSNRNDKVNERLMIKMSEQAPGDLLVEKYLVEIAKSHNVPYKPTPEIAVRDPDFFYAALEKNDKNNRNNGPGGSGSGNSGSGGFSEPPVAAKNIYPTNQQVSYIGFNQAPPVQRLKPAEKPVVSTPNVDDFNFPAVPTSTPDVTSNQTFQNNDYDDLTARFERLKKK